MCKQVKYVFWPDSVTGLTEFVTVNAVNYVEAKKRVMKWIATNRTYKHAFEHCDGELS